MRRFSVRPVLTLKGRTFKGLRGWSGKPLHPPLTDIPIAAYILAAAFDVISAVGGNDRGWAREFFHAGTGGTSLPADRSCTGIGRAETASPATAPSCPARSGWSRPLPPLSTSRSGEALRRAPRPRQSAAPVLRGDGPCQPCLSRQLPPALTHAALVQAALSIRDIGA